MVPAAQQETVVERCGAAGYGRVDVMTVEALCLGAPGEGAAGPVATSEGLPLVTVEEPCFVAHPQRNTVLLDQHLNLRVAADLRKFGIAQVMPVGDDERL